MNQNGSPLYFHLCLKNIPAGQESQKYEFRWKFCRFQRANVSVNVITILLQMWSQYYCRRIRGNHVFHEIQNNTKKGRKESRTKKAEHMPPWRRGYVVAFGAKYCGFNSCPLVVTAPCGSPRLAIGYLASSCTFNIQHSVCWASCYK